MIKVLSIVLVSAACFVKLSITSFKEQLEYPGIQNGTTIANYTIEIENPKEQEIEVEGIWIKGRWIKFSQKSFSSDPFTVRASVKYIPTDSLENKIPSPTSNSKDKGAIKYHIKGKSKVRYIGLQKITRQEPIARP